MVIAALFSTVGFTVIFARAASANSDISCVNSDCLRFGWTTTDLKSGLQLQVQCKQNDCDKNGWTVIFQGKHAEDAVCKTNGCFEDGWRSYNLKKGSLMADVSCLNSFAPSNCLSVGWIIAVPGQESVTYRCVDGDCRNIGWDVVYPAQPVARCKPKGCFVSGWTAYH